MMIDCGQRLNVIMMLRLPLIPAGTQRQHRDETTLLQIQHPTTSFSTFFQRCRSDIVRMV